MLNEVLKIDKESLLKFLLVVMESEITLDNDQIHKLFDLGKLLFID